MLLDQFNTLLQVLASTPQYHARSTALYGFLDGLVKQAFHEAKPAFEEGHAIPFAELGSLILPYNKMGAIDSIDLFGLDELLMFAFYWKNRSRYKRAADIGANMGLHSIVLSKCGIATEAYEPDPQHFVKLQRNLELNQVRDCTPYQAAVSGQDGTMQFCRVLGNTTSSHLAGAKPNPYGDLEYFDVDVKDINAIAARVDLFKIDAEGHEGVLLNALKDNAFATVDAFVEVGTPESARVVFDRFKGSSINVFAQKRGWARVESLDDIPVSYKEGGIFISSKEHMPW